MEEGKEGEEEEEVEEEEVEEVEEEEGEEEEVEEEEAEVEEEVKEGGSSASDDIQVIEDDWIEVNPYPLMNILIWRYIYIFDCNIVQQNLRKYKKRCQSNRI